MRWLETDTFTDQDISSALEVGAYISDGDRLVICDVSAFQVEGNGDYIMYATRQVGGVGAEAVILPKTTMPAEVGETAISGQSAPISVRSGDVIRAYVQGKPADTTTPDTIVRWYDYSACALPAGAIEYTYTVLNSGTGLPVPDVQVWITTDVAGTNVIWTGYTDALGIARDQFNNLPLLDAGTYFIWKQRVGFVDADNPDVETVS